MFVDVCRELDWRVQALDDLLHSGVLSNSHPLVLMLEAMLLQLTRARKLSKLSWVDSKFRPLFDLCESMFNIGGEACYRLFLGRPAGLPEQDHLSPAEFNFFGPSVWTLHQYKLALQHSNGVCSSNVTLFRQIVSRQALTVSPVYTDLHANIVYANLQGDETPIAVGGHVPRGKAYVDGYTERITIQELRVKSELPPHEFAAWLKTLVPATQAMEWHIQDLAARVHMNVGRFFQGSGGGGAKVMTNINALLRTVQCCDSCASGGLQCDSGFCAACHVGQTVCPGCCRAGYNKHHYLQRPCSACRAANRRCERVALVAVSMDGASENSSAANIVEQCVDNNTLFTPLLFVFDPSHFAKNFRNSFANWILKLGKARVCIRWIVGLRYCNVRSVVERLASSCSMQALEYKNRLATQHVAELFRKPVQDVLTDVKTGCFTLIPENLRAWETDGMAHSKLPEVRAIAVDAIGRLYLACKRAVLLVVQSNPVKLLTLAGSLSDALKGKPKKSRLGNARFADLSGCCIVQDGLLVADRDCLRFLDGVAKMEQRSPSQQQLTKSKLRVYAVDVDWSGWAAPVLPPTGVCTISKTAFAVCYGNKPDQAVFRMTLHFTPGPGNGTYSAVAADAWIVPGPRAVAYDSSTESLYVTSHRGVVVIDQDGPRVLPAELQDAQGIAVQSSDCLAVADGSAHVVRRVRRVGGRWVTSVLAGSGNAGQEDGPSGNALLNCPTAIVAEDDTLYIACPSDKSLRVCVELAETATFVSQMRTMMDGCAVLDASSRSDAVSRERVLKVSISTAIEQLSTVAVYLERVVQQRESACAIGKNVQGPEGCFAYNSVRRFVQTARKYQDFHDLFEKLDSGVLPLVRMSSFSTQVAELWFAALRTLGQNRVPDKQQYRALVGTIMKEYVKRVCQIGFNYSTNVIPYYQTPHCSTLNFTDIKFRYRKHQESDDEEDDVALSSADKQLLKYVASVLKPVATQAPTDKYRKRAGFALTLPMPQTAQQLRSKAHVMDLSED